MKVLVRPQCYDQNLNFNPKVEFIIGLALPVFIVIVACLCYFVYKGWSSYKSRAVHCQHIMQDNLSKLRTKLTTLVMVLLFVMSHQSVLLFFSFYLEPAKNFVWITKICTAFICFDRIMKYSVRACHFINMQHILPQAFTLYPSPVFCFIFSESTVRSTPKNLLVECSSKNHYCRT